MPASDMSKTTAEQSPINFKTPVAKKNEVHTKPLFSSNLLHEIINLYR